MMLKFIFKYLNYVDDKILFVANAIEKFHKSICPVNSAFYCSVLVVVLELVQCFCVFLLSDYKWDATLDKRFQLAQGTLRFEIPLSPRYIEIPVRPRYIALQIFPFTGVYIQ